MVEGEGYIKKMGADRMIYINRERDDVPIPKDADDFRVFGRMVASTDGLE
ncbi:hypothetical protein FACS1894208_11030 [Clostridia bacterium]|nr:hypothetical protein FACS1894208_11030 [Clostridia bacterium]